MNRFLSNHQLVSYKHHSSNCPNQDRITWQIGWYNNNGEPSQAYDYYALASYKANIHNWAQAKVEFGFFLYRYDAGVYKLAPMSEFGIWLDKWNQACYKTPGQSSYTCKNDLRRIETSKTWWNPHVKVVSRLGINPNSYCVDEFGRTHNWVWEYNEDVHNDIPW